MTRQKGMFCVLLIVSFLIGGARAEQPAESPVKSSVKKPVWLVVTRPMFTKALQPLVEHRRKDGFETIVSTDPIQAAIQKSPRPPRYLLLVGDDEPGKDKEPWYVPARRMPKTPWVQRKKGTYPSDAIYGDLNNDRFPDIAVGRIPVRTPKQAEMVVRKILTYEAQPPRLEDLDFFIWAGETLFGEAYDRLASTILMQVATKNLPDWVEPYIISAIRGPLYCRLPDHFNYASPRLRRNPGLVLLDGHGWTNHLYLGKWKLHPAQKMYIRLGSNFILYHANKEKPMSPTVILACMCGSFVEKWPCLAEQLVNHPGGPVGCIAASLQPNSLPTLYLAQAIVQTIRQPGRLGDFWLNSIRLGHRIRNPVIEAILQYTQNPLCPKRDMEKIRLEHATHFQLFGDPATQMRIPQHLKCEFTQNGNGTWKWTALKPKDAQKLLVTFRPKAESIYQKPKDWNDTAAVKQAFEKTNQCLSFTPLSEIPADQSWAGTIDTPGTLRLVALGKKRMYTATQKITSKPRKENKK